MSEQNNNDQDKTGSDDQVSTVNTMEDKPEVSGSADTAENVRQMNEQHQWQEKANRYQQAKPDDADSNN